MRPVHLAVIALLFLAAYTPEPARETSYLLIGTWYSVTVGRSVSYGEKTYFADGTACGFFLESPSGQSPATFETFKSKWRLDGTTLTSIVTDTTSPHLTVGEPIVDQVVRIDHDQLVLRPVDSENMDWRYKVKKPRGRKLCELKAEAGRP